MYILIIDIELKKIIKQFLKCSYFWYRKFITIVSIWSQEILQITY